MRPGGIAVVMVPGVSESANPTPPLVALVAALAGCGPSVSEPDVTVGVLEYDDGLKQIYRDTIYIEVRPGAEYPDDRTPPPASGFGCWELDAWAVQQIEDNFAALDPTTDYSVSQGEPECGVGLGQGTMIHRAEMDHSPFACAGTCCHPDLADFSFAYVVIQSNIAGQDVVIDGMAYEAVVGPIDCPQM